MSGEEPGPTSGHAPITLRAPTTSGSSPTTFTAPSMDWLLGTWHVTHSTLPMWKKARNVAITYRPLPSDSTKLDDLVTYQALSSDKTKTISGTDTPAGPGCWNWRGNGWLVIASSHWEVLGFGDEDGDGDGNGDGDDRGKWVVTYFAKTLFTPAGIDFYSSRKGGAGPGTVERIKEALGRVESEVARKLVGELFVVRSD